MAGSSIRFTSPGANADLLQTLRNAMGELAMTNDR
jgi:hypothetical protein